jgi:hypothetical protein
MALKNSGLALCRSPSRVLELHAPEKCLIVDASESRMKNAENRPLLDSIVGNPSSGFADI